MTFNTSRFTATLVGLGLAGLALSACGSTSSSGGGALSKLGKGEGQINIINWAGYVESGQNDPKVDWVTKFTADTGCKVNSKIGNTSDEMVSLMKAGGYDVVSASGDATLRLIAGGDVAPINTALIANYKDVFDSLKMQKWNSSGGKAYGIPHGRGANLLMWNTEKVTPAPTSWSAVFDDKSAYKGAITAYDSPIYIADAALYLMNTKPDLGIKNPYALDDKQFTAAVDLLKKQKTVVGEYWSDYLKTQAAFKTGSTVLGTTWQVIANGAQGEGTKVDTILPQEGSTGWSDTWMISSKAKNPNCAYLWMNYIISPEANAAVAEYFGEAPSNKLACGKTSDPKFCDTFHAADEEYFKKVWYWTTPTKACLDGRGAVCKDYAEWTKAWTEIKG